MEEIRDQVIITLDKGSDLFDKSYFDVLLQFLLNTDICERLQNGETIAWRGTRGLNYIAGTKFKLKKAESYVFWTVFSKRYGLVLYNMGLKKSKN